MCIVLRDGARYSGVVSERPALQLFEDARGVEGMNAQLRLDDPAAPSWICYLWLGTWHGWKPCPCADWGDRLRAGSPQGVQIRSHVARVLFTHAHLGHRGVRLDRMRMHDPAHEIVGRVEQFTRNEPSRAEIRQRRPHQPARVVHAGDLVTAAATVAAQRGRAACGVAAGLVPGRRSTR